MVDTCEKISLIIDTDPAIGIPCRDVDDGLALLFLCALDKFEIKGITTNFGNTNINNTYKIAKDVLKIAGREDIPIFKGASSKNDLGKKTPASEFLIKTVEGNPGKITILAIAPLTNIATAIIQDSRFLKNVKELVIMGGALKFPYFEFNFFSDHSSAKIVLTGECKKTIITFDVCKQIVFRPKHYTMIDCKNKEIKKYIKRNIISWLLLNMFFSGRGFSPYDVIAVSYLCERSLFKENILNFISLTRFGKINAYKRNNTGTEINIPINVEKDKVMKLFIDTLNRL